MASSIVGAAVALGYAKLKITHGEKLATPQPVPLSHTLWSAAAIKTVGDLRIAKSIFDAEEADVDSRDDDLFDAYYRDGDDPSDSADDDDKGDIFKKRRAAKKVVYSQQSLESERVALARSVFRAP